MSHIETIGDATLYLGDCREILPTLGKVDMVVTDPPYSSGGMYRADRSAATTGKYQISHETARTYAAFAGDNRDQRSFERWCDQWMTAAHRICNEGGVLACFIDWRNIASVVDTLQVAGWVYRGITPWHKGPDMRPVKGWFRRNVEFVVWGTCGSLEVPTGDDISYPDGMFFHRVNGVEKEHQTGKPLDLMMDLINVRPELKCVLDPFMGSGTTGVAALKLGRKFIGIELEPAYFDVARRRIEEAWKQPRLFEEPAPKAEQLSLLSEGEAA